MSNWQTQSDISQFTLTNNDWLGLSIATRRPFISQEATPSLSNPTQNKIDFIVYPNPTSSVLNIQTEEQSDHITIFSISGKHLLQTTNTSIEVSSLNSGTYIIELLINNKKNEIVY